MDQREIGATSTPCRKPSRRSSTIEIVEKMAVNSRIITSVPGKKCAYPRFTCRRPSLNNNQKMIGCPKAPKTRFFWRKKRTNSRQHKVATAPHDGTPERPGKVATAINFSFATGGVLP